MHFSLFFCTCLFLLILLFCLLLPFVLDLFLCLLYLIDLFHRFLVFLLFFLCLFLCILLVSSFYSFYIISPSSSFNSPLPASPHPLVPEVSRREGYTQGSRSSNISSVWLATFATRIILPLTYSISPLSPHCTRHHREALTRRYSNLHHQQTLSSCDH